MLSKAIILFAATCVAATEEHSTEHTQDWLYADVDGRGPSGWADIYPNCSASAQSPINIHESVADDGLQALKMYYTMAEGFEIINTQHSVEIGLMDDNNYLVDPNNKNKKYTLQQLHFHSPSEHGIGGGLFDLEMHMVHKLTTADESETFQYVVIAVLFRQGSAPNRNFGFFNALPSVPMPGFENYGNASAIYEYTNVTLSEAKFDFEGLLSSNKYYTYDGSFTTPPCTEGVKWYVMQDVLPVSKMQVDAFRNAMMFDEELVIADGFGWQPALFQYYGNNRPMQALNSRKVLSFNDAHENNDAGHTTAWKMGVAAVVLAAFAIVLALAALFVGMAGSKAPSNSHEPVADEDDEPKADGAVNDA
eukprot:TRINITY_DN326_c0_g1_i2.p2 TRINITY_DN326_c0_g1~~TRINITY_DN326_c0_g1_i2.p2  ORF type:complete len:380 (+),score=142.67 TRINITY_DN326_c0_g1_i2:52-1140(+)